MREPTCATCGAPLERDQQFCTRCGAAAPERAVSRDPLRDRLQDLLGGEYELLDVVGRGGMAVVYAARDPLLERRVAVKAMLPEFATDAEMADRFLREARTAAQLQHPNIVSVFGARSRGDLLVMIMAFVEGRSVDAVLHEQGRLPLHVAGRLAADVASALQYAHEHQVIHRDVKPANVLLASNGGALVSDFGIARRQDVPGLTGEGMMLGSLSYMSPEQRSAQPLTGATDQYALGVTVFEMLAGRGPFVGPPIDVHVAHLNDAPPSVREFRPEVPEAVAQAIARMLAKSPDERYPTLREPMRVFERLVTDARSVSAEIAKLSGVLAAPTASRVISAVRKAPTAPMPATPRPSAASTDATSAPTVVTGAREAPVAPATAGSSRIIFAAVAAAVVILGGAVLLKQRLDAPTAGPPKTAADMSAPAASAGGAGTAPAAQPEAARGDASTQRGAAEPAREAASTNAAGAPGRGGSGVPLGTAQIQPAPSPSPNAAPTAAATPTVSPSAVAAPPAAAEPAPALTDARAAARTLVTMMNQRRVRDLERLGDAGDGDPAARRALEKLVRDGEDFAAGFDRMASAPDSEGGGFVTEFVIEASWRSGGKETAALYDVRVRLARQGEAWNPVAYSVRARP
ncbi:MAG: protein kinase [Gemmatimonadetes bacterium]|nr:protein kinase [Gemmatimonadota bacterium]